MYILTFSKGTHSLGVKLIKFMLHMMKIHFCCLSVCLSNHSFKTFFLFFFVFLYGYATSILIKLSKKKKLFPFFFSILVITNY